MCLICQRIQQIQEGCNPYFVKELQTGYVVLGDHQHFQGYTLFLCKEHQTELFHLPPATKVKYLEEMSLVAEAVAKAFHAEKMNYELLGKETRTCTGIFFPAGPTTWRAMGTTAKARYGGIPWRKCMTTPSARPRRRWKP